MAAPTLASKFGLTPGPATRSALRNILGPGSLAYNRIKEAAQDWTYRLRLLPWRIMSGIAQHVKLCSITAIANRFRQELHVLDCAACIFSRPDHTGRHANRLGGCH